MQKQKFQKLKPDDVIRAGDVLAKVKPTLSHSPAVQPGSRWVGAKVGDVVKLWDNVWRPVEQPDPVIAKATAAAKRARSRTRLGKLEALIDERRRWQRRQTIAQNKLAFLTRAIEGLAVSLADSTFDEDLTGRSAKPAPAPVPEPTTTSILNIS